MGGVVSFHESVSLLQAMRLSEGRDIRKLYGLWVELFNEVDKRHGIEPFLAHTQKLQKLVSSCRYCRNAGSSFAHMCTEVPTDAEPSMQGMRRQQNRGLVEQSASLNGNNLVLPNLVASASEPALHLVETDQNSAATLEAAHQLRRQQKGRPGGIVAGRSVAKNRMMFSTYHDRQSMSWRG
eukprot:gnl/TRDRNA2_/TRDRNA2_142587_c2_seq1.p1 gnl/TRDRNA2_/TRDRNA2_142587_c2~~gnl/TRDRNA2_/TRDRNA2_142587_c2_seq1.p1  ORF type:complete len:198 (+),score=23.39 gnl/TRDRNA2_/TRDRNA2_142587_c2_seq1:53-595(+)